MISAKLGPEVRCGIYTRKSTDNNLDMAFNTLEAQREACELYAQERKAQGWKVVAHRYDDGGFSGGTMERPALKKLLDDVRNGLIDCILVYKIDRVSRSQLDFLQLLKMLAEHKVAFVSVTQPFETATAAGRAMLGSMMVFAQLEREMASERIRDKWTASRRRGIWMGGVVPFGYRSVDKKLCIDQAQSQVILSIFQKFISLGSATKLAQEFLRDGTTTRSGKPIDKGFIYKVLNNRVYLGEAVHKESSYPGEHEPIIAQEIWDKVQGVLKVSPRQRAAQTRAQTPALLKGLIFGPGGVAMSPTHTRRRGRLYRYYVSQTILKKGAGSCEVPRVPAGEVESLVINELRSMIRSPQIIFETWRKAKVRVKACQLADVTEALTQLDPLWEHLLEPERARIVQLVVARVEVVSPLELKVHFRTDGISALARELTPLQAKG
jgi:site-specific DNA recombinase